MNSFRLLKQVLSSTLFLATLSSTNVSFGQEAPPDPASPKAPEAKAVATAEAATPEAPLPAAPPTGLPALPDFSKLPPPPDPASINSEEEAMAAIEALLKAMEAEAQAQGIDLGDMPPIPSGPDALGAEAGGSPLSGAPAGRPTPFGPGNMGMNAGDSSSALGGPLPGGQEERVGPIVLVDETAHQVLELLQKLTGKTILMQQTLPPLKVNFNSIRPVTKEEAISALESVLSLNGVAVTAVNETQFKAVPTIGVNTQAPQILTESTLKQAPSQKVYSKFYPLEYLGTEEAIGIIQPFLTPGVSSLIPFPKSDALLVTDALINLQRVEDILAHADKPVFIREEILFFNLKNITATEMQKRLETLYEKTLKGYIQGNTSFESDERTNQLIVITHASNIPTIRRFIDTLDVDSAPITQSKVYTLRYAESTKVTELIQQVINGQKQSFKEEETRNKKLPGDQASKLAEGKDILQFSNYITIVADDRSNAIVAYGTRSDLNQVANLVKEIDVLLPQVRIEVIISEVALRDQGQRGIDSFGIKWNENKNGVLQVDTGGPSSSGIGGPELFKLGVGGQSLSTATIDAVLGTAERDDDVSILSTPTIVTTHNQEGKIEIVEQRPIITQQNTDVTNTNSITNSVSYKDIGIVLTVKPLIGLNGVIQMEITQKVENVISNQKINDVEQPIIGKREATSFVSVNDGEMIILGGLQENKRSDSKNKMFILGQLPVIGGLFTSDVHSYERRELIIFIVPHLITNTTEGNKDAQLTLARSENKAEVTTYMETGKFPEMKKEKPKPKKKKRKTGPRRS